MTDIGFYHLTRTGALDALPRLLGRTLALGQRALVLSAHADSLPEISVALWASDNPDWLPHGGEDRTVEPAEWQPIWLAAKLDGPPPNGARYLFLLGGAAIASGFDRIFDLFDGNNEIELRQARLRWSAAKAAGHKLTYWQQGDRGWTAKA